ncbi:hypothetical protein ABB37_08848 [Leptomonas pyrrhocoris]|uniref:Secreted protein n=1 Tax=Leptomonas pyrrhocoris TaxID=157538 RepID=A0A0M9FRZ4_LEPPY|nr:hypothetical protein ABB37_08848 [Leptomonas pyrrhocoris]XP_015653253.1 hypothetical protein ABB37_08848 [Leptomonas pyrrhocoris]KPA74813.1 hypothetical protein ABB37_08848 [Leptomonas pyrrhocoris]KPA74814.1 hypothetical protein ABB37_08848 [Leptomonas pyrrhocoris]|eukprot:XP_015653252.1 hypothetical protein ABB37_08848 [Leptomonas pyrrhocoris]
MEGQALALSFVLLRLSFRATASPSLLPDQLSSCCCLGAFRYGIRSDANHLHVALRLATLLQGKAGSQQPWHYAMVSFSIFSILAKGRSQIGDEASRISGAIVERLVFLEGFLVPILPLNEVCIMTRYPHIGQGQRCIEED